MKKLISKVTLVAFIYHSLLVPLAAMEASGPAFQHHPQGTAVVQVDEEQRPTQPAATPQLTQHNAKTATASTLTPWKRALEYYRWGQYKDMAGEMCCTFSMVLLGVVVVGLTALSLYSLYSYFTRLTPFGEALTGQQSHSISAGHYQLTTPAPQKHDVMKTAWNMMAGHNNLTKTLFAAAGFYLQGGNNIPNDVWDSIQTGTKPLQGAFQYLPENVQSVFFQLCFSPQGHLATLGNYPLSDPQLITHQNYHNICNPSQIDVRLAIQRPITENARRKGKSDSPHLAAFTHLSKMHEHLVTQNGHADSRRTLLGFDDKPYSAAVTHLFHNTTGLISRAYANALKLRADLCPGNMTMTLTELMQPLQSITSHTDKDYTFFYLWFNTKGALVKTDYQFADDLEDFKQGGCDFDTAVGFGNDAHVRLAMDDRGRVVTTAKRNDLLEITPTQPVVTPSDSKFFTASGSETPPNTLSPSQTIHNPCGVVNATRFLFNTTQGIHDLFDYVDLSFAMSWIIGSWGFWYDGNFIGGIPANSLTQNFSNISFNCITDNPNFWPRKPIGYFYGCNHRGGNISIPSQAYKGSIRYQGIGTYGGFDNTKVAIVKNYGLKAEEIIQYFNVTGTSAAQVNHVLANMHTVLMANATTPEVQAIVPVYNALVEHYTNSTRTDADCFEGRVDVAQIMQKDPTKFYWYKDKTIYVGDINQTTGLPINERPFISPIKVSDPFHIDSEYNKIYWIKPAVSGNCGGYARCINVGDINTTHVLSPSNVIGLLGVSGAPHWFSIFQNKTDTVGNQWKILVNGGVEKYIVDFNRTHPTALTNPRKFSFVVSLGIDNIFFDNKYNYAYGFSNGVLYVAEQNHPTNWKTLSLEGQGSTYCYVDFQNSRIYYTGKHAEFGKVYIGHFNRTNPLEALTNTISFSIKNIVKNTPVPFFVGS